MFLLQPGSIYKNIFCALNPRRSYILFCLLLHIHSAVFGTEPKQGRCKNMHLFFVFFVTMDQNKEKRHGNVSTLTLLFSERSAGLFWEWMRLRGPRGELPAAEAVCEQIKTRVTVGNLRLRVTHNPLRSRQEAAAEYFLFLPPCRRQTGATL